MKSTNLTLCQATHIFKTRLQKKKKRFKKQIFFFSPKKNPLILILVY